MSKNSNFDNNEKNTHNKDSNLNLALLEKMEEGGLNYIRKEQLYLKISAIFPIYSIFINIINILFILIGIILIRSGYLPSLPPEIELTQEQLLIVFLHFIVPLGIFLIISIFSIIQLIFLKKWKYKIQDYFKYKDLNANNEGKILKIESRTKSEECVTLTNLFYDIIHHMEKIRVLFLLINVFSFFYLLWSFRFFVLIVIFLMNDMIRFFNFLFVLNLSGAFVLILFLIYMWYHFKRWNKKLKTLKKYEQKIAKELDL